MSPLFEKISYFMSHIHGFLFPIVAEELGELTVKQQQLIKILEIMPSKARRRIRGVSLHLGTGKSSPSAHRFLTPQDHSA